MSERPHDDAMRELDERLDAALDALNAERAPEIAPDADPELRDLVDAARVVRRLREPAVPDDRFPEQLAAGLVNRLGSAPVDVTYSPNGHVTLAPLPPTLRWRRARAAATLLAALLRSLTVVVLAGMLAGVVVGGIGGRLAMFVAGEIYLREHPGQVTITESSGRVVGSFSWDGTIDLLVEGLFNGMLGGIALLLLRPWLARAGRREGVAYGALLLLAAGAVVFSADNPDFARIGWPWLNVLMFGALFLAFGPLVVALARRLDRRLPRLGLRGPWRPGRVIGTLLIIAVGGFALLPLTLLLAGGIINLALSIGSLAQRPAPAEALRDLAASLALFVIAIVVPLARIVRSPRMAPFVANHRRIAALARGPVARAVDVALLLVIAAGGAVTVATIARILA